MEPQVIELFLAELKHEISRKAVNISFDCSHKHFGLDTVKLRNPSPCLCESRFIGKGGGEVPLTLTLSRQGRENRGMRLPRTLQVARNDTGG